MRLRVTLRAKLALLSLVLLVLPWVGYQYVQETERLLLDSQRESVLALARAVATALHDRPEIFSLASGLAPGASVAPGEHLLELGLGLTPSRGPAAAQGILQGLERSTSRIWVADRGLRVVARAGRLAAPDPKPEPGAHAAQRAWRWVIGKLLPPPSQKFIRRADQEPLTRGVDISNALLGLPAVSVRSTGDGRPSIVSAAHPVWVGDQVRGAVVVEESTHSILSLRNRALERLLLVTLGAFGAVALMLIGFASRLSWRIRRLRDEADGAIDASGRVTRISAASTARDEVGDLSRSISALLGRIGRHHGYLESMASRLSHELRTPIAVVRSSLENLHMEALPDSARTYIERAEAGVSRLSRIFNRMSEANRMEQSLASTEVERFDLGRLVEECMAGYRVARPDQPLDLSLPRHPVWVRGAPDLMAQLLDKLIENAFDFAAPGSAVRVTLGFDGEAHAVLAVENQGPTLPEELKERLFESMVSGRSGEGGEVPHLGLGLYVARMIAGFHGGDLSAANLADGGGVRFSVRLPSHAVEG
ncbi:MAG: hypothetical protein KDH20_17650 [Rhodocyclaceae bacterium]|nr:hypothetical protein [Rhodocyclaceae bacterium]